MVTSRGALKADSSLILPAFTDTSKANISQFIKNYAGTLIRVGDSLYVRSNDVSKWILIGSGGGGATNAWLLTGNSDAIAGYNYLGTINNIPLEFRVKNIKSGIIDSNYRNTALGYASQRFSQATVGTDSAIYNTSMGFRALGANVYGDQNTSIGYAANALGTNLKANTAVGYGAGAQNRTSSFDVAVGWGALPRNYYGYANTAVGADIANIYAPGVGDTMTYNTMLGYGSAYYKYTGRNNVFVGDSTGANNTTGSRNVFVGSKAGKNETGSDKLYIANSSTSNPLIKGNFGDSTLNVNGKLSISLTSQKPDSSLDVTGGVKLRRIYRSGALTDSMLLVGADGGVVKREVIIPSNTNVTRIISGSAVWDSLLVYSVTKCFYYINGILYNSAATNITLVKADSSNPRIDVVYCDTLGNVGVITGIPSPNPVKPTVNPLSQIELTHININAQGKTPAGVSSKIVYNENVGVPNEWNTSKSLPLSPANFAYTINPYIGTKSAYAPPYELNYSLIFTNNAFVNADTLSELSMYLRQNSAPISKLGTNVFSVILYKSGVKITDQIFISDGFYGYSLSTLNSYQHLAIPFSSFVWANPLDKTFDQIQILLDFSTIPKLGFQFDYITVGAGGNPPAVISNYWSLTGNDNTSFPNAKLGTTSKDKLSIVTSDVERINIANTGVISLPQLQTTTDTLLYKPLVINPTNGQVAGITNWGNNTVYTENPIMSRTSGDSNIIYFNPDTANVWRGGGSGTIPTLQQVLDNNHELVNEINLQGTLAGDGSTLTSNVNALGGNAAGQVYNGITDMNAFGNYAGYLYGADDGAPHSNINLFGNNAGEEAFGNNINGLGYYSAQLNYGNDVNAMGYNSAQGNQGSNVNAFGNGAGVNNTYSDVNLFGQGAMATASNQIVFAGSSGAIQSRIQQPSTTQTYTLPEASGNLTLSVNGYSANSSGAITIPLGGSGTVTDISQGYGITASPTNPITVSGTIEVDTVTLSGKYLRINDTTAMLSPYAKTSALNLKLNIADTSSMLLPYLRKVDTASLSNRIDLRVKYSDTSSMLLPYLRKIDTTNKFVNNISRIPGKDSIIFNIGSTRYAIKDSTGLPNLQQVLTAGNNATIPLSISQAGQYSQVNATNFQSNATDLNNTWDSKLDPFELVFTKNTFTPTFSSKIEMYPDVTISGNHFYRILPPISGNTTDTIATLRDIRAGGGSGGGTVTSITQGYGITNSPNPIIATGTITVDTATLSGKYLRIVDTTNKWVSGSGTATRVPYWSASRALTSSPNMIWNTPDSSLGVSNFYTGTAGSTQFDINSTANSLPATLGIWRKQVNGNYTYLKEDEQGGAQHKWAFVRRDGFNQTRDFYQVNSSIMNINLGWGNPNSSNYDGSTLLINPNINITNALNTGTTIRGIYYNPTLTSLTNTKHIAFQSTSGDIILNKLKTSSSTSDSIAIFINDTLKKAPYPTVAGVSSGYYGAFEDTLSQTITSTTTAYPLNFRVTDLSNGVSVVNNNRILFANAGIYNLQYSAQFTNSSTSTEVGISVWIRKNGVDVAGSNGYIQLPKKGSGLNGETLPSWNFVLSLAAGDSIVWYWRADNTAASITSFAAGTSPTRPSTASTILTVTQQSGIMAGTGITGLGTSGNIQTGATQTLATGTSGTDFTISSSSNTQTFNLPTASASNTGKLSSTDWTTFNGKIGAADTSVFQRKSISSYTMLANNTNATANATAQTFRDTAGTYAGTIAWNGTAPTTQTINRYQWQQTGKMVRLQLFGYYTNAGSGCSAVSLTIPADCPAPDISMFTSGATAILYTGTGGLGLSNTSLTTTTNAYIRRNTGNTDNELYITAASANYRRYQIDITYRAQ